MANNDSDLFDRMRQAGLRKQVAKTLSQLGQGANKKALRAAQTAVTDLRSLADEIERHLPGGAAKTNRSAKPPARRRTSTSSAGTSAAASATRASSGTATPARAPRGQNKAQILQSLKTGPKTASQISQQTGIATRTVGSTLSKLATSGEVVKAQRGYALPG